MRCKACDSIHGKFDKKLKDYYCPKCHFEIWATLKAYDIALLEDQDDGGVPLLDEGFDDD